MTTTQTESPSPTGCAICAETQEMQELQWGEWRELERRLSRLERILLAFASHLDQEVEEPV